MIRIVAVGDIMPGGVLALQSEYIQAGLRAFLDSFDIRVGTLECAIGSGYSFDKVKMEGRKNIIYAREEDFYRVKEIGFDVVSLANNHLMDLGKEGLHNTIRVLKENEVLFCGAGDNMQEASMPAVVSKEGKTIAFLAYCMTDSSMMGYVECASKESAGVNCLDLNRVLSDIENNKKKYDYVIVLPHWGKEYEYWPADVCRKMAKRMIKAGADAVLGSHTHQAQPMVRFRRRPICYSMGNFLFPDFYMYPPRPIWYPDKNEDLSIVKDVVGYPFPILEPIRQVWNGKARIGETIVLEIDAGTIEAQNRFVKLDNDNVLDLVHDSKEYRRISHRLRKIGFLMNIPGVYPTRNLVRKVNKIIKRLLYYRH